jgi:prophage tail gpP-like protein
LRLTAKFRRLLARKLMKTKATVAVARELAGFIWAIGQWVQVSSWPGLREADDPVATPAH